MSKKKADYDEKKLYTTRQGKKLPWSKVRAGSVLLPADQFVYLKDFFENFCHQNQCPDGIGDWNSFAKDLGNHITRK